MQKRHRLSIVHTYCSRLMFSLKENIIFVTEEKMFKILYELHFIIFIVQNQIEIKLIVIALIRYYLIAIIMVAVFFVVYCCFSFENTVETLFYETFLLPTSQSERVAGKVPGNN